jgi:C1A family cysteine protease
MPRQTKRFGWIPDIPDARDHLYSAPLRVLEELPSSVDLRSLCPPVLDQGQLGSCTANAIASAHRFDQMKQGAVQVFAPSRLFIYYNERVMEHTMSEDSGAMIRDGIKSIASDGVCAESMWPYAIPKFATRPTPSCYEAALDHQAVSYQRVLQTPTQMKGCLASGYPFVFGFTVYESFESPAVTKTGVVPLPSPGESMLGGHAVLAVGYDDDRQRFLAMNSWGSAWGERGYFTIPYSYLTDADLSADFWTVRVVEV